jgi:hypothetical protein
MPHSWIDSQTLGVIGVLIARKPAVNRLPEQSGKVVLRVLARSDVTQLCMDHRDQAECLIKLPVGKQTSITGDLSSMKFELQFAIKIEPQSVLPCFTHWVLP